MNFGRFVLSAILLSLIFIIILYFSLKGLETTWLGIYNAASSIENPYANEYSCTYFLKSKCEEWIKEKKSIYGEAGSYICGKNCQFRQLGLLDCEKLYQY